MMELILGEKPQDYDVKKHLLFSPACVFHDQDGLFAGKYQFAKYEFTRKNYREIRRMAGDFYRPLLEQFSVYLNQQNSIHETVIFWEVVIGDWLLFSLGKIFEAKKRLEAFYQQNNLNHFNVSLIEIENSDSSGFARQADFNKAAQQCLTFNHYLYSIAFKFCSFPDWTQQQNVVSYWRSSPTTPVKSLTWRKRLFHFLKAPLRIQAIFGFTPIHFLFLQFALVINSLFNRNNIYLSRTNASASSNNPWYNPLFNQLLKILPKEYFQLREKCNPPIKYKNGFFFSDNIKSPALDTIKLAKMRSCGVSVYLCQHGSSYGDVDMTVKNELFDMSRFGFISWGLPKSYTQKNNMFFLPSPMLARIAYQKPIKDRKDFVVVSTVLTPFNLSSSSSYDPNYVEDYFKRITTILRLVHVPSGESLYFRPRMTHRENSFDIFGQVQARCPDIPILNGDLEKLMPDLKMLILTDPGSVLHKCLAANIPFLICWNRKAWIMSDEYEEHLDRLKKNGIFYDDADTLSSILNGIGKDIDTWWNDAERQKAIKLFRQDFAPVVKYPFLIWFKTLCRIPKIVAE